MTPSPFSVDSSPSMGAFNALRDTPIPRRISALELDRIASSDMIAAGASRPAATIVENAPKRRWVIPILVAFAIVGAGLGALVATRGEDAPAPATRIEDDAWGKTTPVKGGALPPF